MRPLKSWPILLLGSRFFNFRKSRHWLYWSLIHIRGRKAREVCLNLKISVEWLQSIQLFSRLSSPMRNLTIHKQSWIHLLTGPLGRECSVRAHLPRLSLARVRIIGAFGDLLLIAFFPFACSRSNRPLPLFNYIQRFLPQHLCIKSSILFFEIIPLVFRPFLLPLLPGFTVGFGFRLCKGLLVSTLAFVYC